MISAVSELVVEDLGKYSLNRVHGIIETDRIRHMSVIVEKTPVRRKFWADNQYIAYGYLISELLKGDSDGFSKIPVKTTKFPNYSKEKEISCNASGKLCFQIFEQLPHLKAHAKASGGILIKIKQGDLELHTLDENALENALRGRSVEKDHSFIISFLKKTRRRICIVTSVVVTAAETVIGYSSKYEAGGRAAAKAAGQGGSLQVDSSRSASGMVTLKPGTVLACNWKILQLDKDTGEIKLDYILSAPKIQKSAVLANCSFEDSADGSTESINYRPPELSDLKGVSEDDRNKFKVAIKAIQKCSSDIDALMELFENKIANTKKLQEKVKHREAVWSLLHLSGYTIQGNYFKKTTETAFGTAVESVIEAFDVCFRDDVECITNCNKYQREGVLNIIKRAIKGETRMQVDTKFFEEIQKEPVEKVLAIMNFDIDFKSSSVVTTPNNACPLKGMCYLFAYL